MIQDALVKASNSIVCFEDAMMLAAGNQDWL